jgi:Undecaprenyl-phosphate galactose phosphotransferase WbaP
MSQVGAIITEHAASKRLYGGWPRGYPRVVRRFRRPLVAASLIFGDLIAAIATISFSRALLEIIGNDPLVSRTYPIVFLILAFFCVGLYAGCGPSPYERLRLRTIGIAVFVGIDMLLSVSEREPVPLFIAGLCTGINLLIFGYYVEIVIRSLLIRLNLWGASAAVVGYADDGRNLAKLLMDQPAFGLAPIGFIKGACNQGSYMASLPLPEIEVTNADRIASQVEFVLFTSAAEVSTLAAASPMWLTHCRLLLVEDVGDVQSLWLRPRTLGRAIGIEIRPDLRLRHNQLIKRLIDIVFAVPVALLVMPIVAVLALLIKLVDPGPAFYVQERVGRNATRLRMFKLRTMYVDAEQRLDERLRRDPQANAEWQRFFKLSDDPRILPILGNFMRRTSLDELPQLFHVIRGEMSLVGPRPFPTYHMNSFDEEFRAVRVSVAPGLTGMWQVSSRSNGDLQAQKAQDLFYIRNWSVWLDVYILLETVVAVLTGKGAR